LCDAGIRPAGADVWTAIRIEAGLPLYGVDITDDNLAQEVGRTKSAISFTKGCYLGQEPIARIDAMGHVNRELRGLRLSSGPIPAAGSSVFADPSGTQVIGTVTSVAISYRTEMPVAIAVLRLNALTPGTQVWVKTDRQNVSATVFWPPSEDN
jgi:folate-binding protein YgfZ